MKILVDATIGIKENWFETIPINIDVDGVKYLDSNQLEHKKAILTGRNISTAFLSPESVKKLKGEKTIIFTIPRSLSGQYNAYHPMGDKNTLVIEGTALFVFQNEVKQIINQTSSLVEIEKQITELNEKVVYDGIIFDFNLVPKKGRIAGVLISLVSRINTKAWLRFSNQVWKRKKIFRNLQKTIKLIVGEKKSLTLIVPDQKVFEKFKKIINELDNTIVVNKQSMTNAMIAHSGSGFICLY